MNNIKVQREIIANGAPNIGITGNPVNVQIYNAAYDKYLINCDAAAARKAIGVQFGKGEITSNTRQPYATYYGGYYDKYIAPHK